MPAGFGNFSAAAHHVLVICGRDHGRVGRWRATSRSVGAISPRACRRIKTLHVLEGGTHELTFSKRPQPSPYLRRSRTDRHTYLGPVAGRVVGDRDVPDDEPGGISAAVHDLPRPDAARRDEAASDARGPSRLQVAQVRSDYGSGAGARGRPHDDAGPARCTPEGALGVSAVAHDAGEAREARQSHAGGVTAFAPDHA